MNRQPPQLPRFRCCLFLLAIAANVLAAGCAKNESKSDLPGDERLSKGNGDFAIKLQTSKGTVVIDVHPSWAPNGASRFRELATSSYYDGCKFYRVVRGFMAQSGVNGDPQVTAIWNGRPINDDPPKTKNVRGTVCMARSGAANSATTEFFINTKDNLYLESQGYAPFGRVVEGMENIENLFSDYGDCPPLGEGPDQRRFLAEGEAYVRAGFPLLDHIISAKLR